MGDYFLTIVGLWQLVSDGCMANKSHGEGTQAAFAVLCKWTIGCEFHAYGSLTCKTPQSYNGPCASVASSGLPEQEDWIGNLSFMN